MNSRAVIYTPRPDATPETEVIVLSAVYTFALGQHAKKKAAEASGGKVDGKGDKYVPATGSIPYCSVP